MFSTVVHPGNDETSEDASVHGIPRAELLLGPHFAEAFGRLEQFLQYACLSVLESDDDSEDGRLPPVAMKQNLEVTVVAHNGLKFDFPFFVAGELTCGLGPCCDGGLDLRRFAGCASCHRLRRRMPKASMRFPCV